MKKTMSVMVRISVALALVAALAVNAVAASAPRMTKEKLRSLLDNPDLIIVDVRTGKDWKSSEYKIKGAVRVDPRGVDSWASQYGKDKTLVLYCA